MLVNLLVNPNILGPSATPQVACSPSKAPWFGPQSWAFFHSDIVCLGGQALSKEVKRNIQYNMIHCVYKTVRPNLYNTVRVVILLFLCMQHGLVCRQPDLICVCNSANSGIILRITDGMGIRCLLQSPSTQVPSST